MQRKRKYSNAHGLAMLFGQRLLHELDTDVQGLNRNLSFPTNGKPFVLGVNPPGHAGFNPPRVFNALLDDGAWPDQCAFIEPDDLSKSKRYNLYRRVCDHLPAMTPWLFADLRDVGYREPIDLRAVQHAIDRHARAYGLLRMHPLVGQALLCDALQMGVNPILLFAPLGGRLLAAQDAASTTFLSLLWLEAQAWSPWRKDLFTDAWGRYALNAWTQLMRQPWLRRDAEHFREIRKAVRGMLGAAPGLRCIHPLPRPTSTVELTTPLSLLWRPTPEEQAAHDRLFQWRWRCVVQASEEIMGHRFARPTPVHAPATVVADIELVVAGFLTSVERMPETPSWKILRPAEPAQRQKKDRASAASLGTAA